MTPAQFQKFAKEMASKIARDPRNVVDLRNQIRNIGLDSAMIPTLVQMKQFAVIKFMLAQHNHHPRDLENALQKMLEVAQNETPRVQIQLMPMILSVVATTPALELCHTRAKKMLELARAHSKKIKSQKSQRNRARKERLRRNRMNR